MAAPIYNYYWDSTDPARPFTVAVTCNAISLVPDNATRTPPPTYKKGTIPCWDGNQWIIKLDWRQEKLYDKSTGELTGFPTVDVDEVILDRDYTIIPPATKYDKWDGEQWVTDTDAQKRDRIAVLKEQWTTLIKVATEQIDHIGDVILYKKSIEDEDLPQYKQLLKNWRVYRGGLLTMKITSGDEKFLDKPKTLDEFMG